MNCAVCGFLVSLIENYSDFKKADIAEFLSNEFCKMAPQ